MQNSNTLGEMWINWTKHNEQTFSNRTLETQKKNSTLRTLQCLWGDVARFQLPPRPGPAANKSLGKKNYVRQNTGNTQVGFSGNGETPPPNSFQGF